LLNYILSSALEYRLLFNIDCLLIDSSYIKLYSYLQKTFMDYSCSFAKTCCTSTSL